MRFVLEYGQEEYPMAALCRRFGISRKTGYKWLLRYESKGPDGLHDRSRAPKCHPNQVQPEIEAAILSARLAHPTWGPKKLRVLLMRYDPQNGWPVISTIGEILKRHGLTAPRKRRRRTPPYDEPFRSCRAPNAVWCADFKGWFRTGDGSRCEPLTITDAHSRYLLRCQTGTDVKYEMVRGLFEATFREYGLPGAIRTDNGSPFASCGVSGLSRLSVWWLKLGIVPERIEPGKPQQNGRHERMHRTLKQETAAPPAQTLRGQQRRFERFRREFNEERPHEALGMLTPAAVYEVSSRAYPERLRDMEYPECVEVRRVKPNGAFNWKNRRVFLGEAFSRELVGLSELTDRYWRVQFGPAVLGVLDTWRFRLLRQRELRRTGLPSGIVCWSSFRYAPGTPADPRQKVSPMCPV